jgi:uncharacterized membrane protein YqaE (UPF0057 family)
MIKFIKSCLAIFLPWVVLLMDDNPGGAFLALILQGSLIGWIPASVWAWGIVHKNKQTRKSKPKKDAS